MHSARLLQFTAVVTMCTITSVLGIGPDINLYWKHLKVDNVTILQFICTTSTKTLGCAVEFHVNDKTEDDIRFVNDKCVHKDGQCLSHVCDCSNDCKTFRLNFTISTGNSITTFGCGTGISIWNDYKRTNITYSLRTAVQQYGKDFRVWEKHVIAVSIEKHCDTIKLDPESTTKSTATYLIIGIVSLVTIFTSIYSYSQYKGLNCTLPGLRDYIYRRQTRQTRPDEGFSELGNPREDTDVEFTASGLEDPLRPSSGVSTISSSSTERSISPQERIYITGLPQCTDA